MFLRPPGPIIPPPPPIIDPVFELTETSVWIGWASMLPAPSFSGTLEIARFTFEVTDQPAQPENATFSMTITDSTLADTNGLPISHTTEDLSIPLYGRSPFNIKIEEVNHPQAVCYGFPIYIEVLIVNDGDHTLTFNLTLTINGTVTRISHVEMEGGWTVLVLYFLDSTKYPLGDLTVDATVQLLSGDSNATDNTYDAGNLTVTIIGDVNGDLSVNIFDVVAITSIYGGEQGDSQYRVASDLNHDGQINILDVTTCTSYYGAKYP
jgi:hypothetical protein